MSLRAVEIIGPRVIHGCRLIAHHDGVHLDNEFAGKRKAKFSAKALESFGKQCG